MPANEHEFSFRGDGKVLKLVSGDGCITPKNLQTTIELLHLKKSRQNADPSLPRPSVGAGTDCRRAGGTLWDVFT